MPWLKKEVSWCGQGVTEPAGPCVLTKCHRIGFAVREIEHHDWEPCSGASVPILQNTIDVYIAKSVASYENCICFVDVSRQCSVKRMERLDEQLVEFVPASNKGRLRKRLSFRTLLGRSPVEVIEERFYFRQVIPPIDRTSVLILEGMMHTTMKVIDESPFLAQMNAGRVELAAFAKTSEGIRPRREGGDIVVEVVDTNLERFAQPVKKTFVLLCGIA